MRCNLPISHIVRLILCFFDFRYLPCCCGYNPYAFIAHTVQQRVKLPPPGGFLRIAVREERKPSGSIRQTDTICLCGAGRPVRHDPVASPQDGTPTKQVSDKTRPQNRCGNLWARIRRQDNETPALNALKALRGAPISMGRGEIPVELRPAAVRFLPLLWF